MNNFVCEVCENEYPDKRRRECKFCSKDICEFCSIGMECCEECYVFYMEGEN